MRILVEVTTEKEDQDIDGDMGYDKEQYYLLHWGMKSEVFIIDEDHTGGVSYTVAVCQHVKSGAIRTFLPDQLRVLGVEIKEEK